MRIAVMSDSHDHIWNLRKAVDLCNSLGSECILHCGDLVAPFMLKELARFNGAVHLVFGNNDGDRFLLGQLALTEFQNVTIHGLLARVRLGGARICFSHYREAAMGMLHEEPCDLACFGHTHQEYLGTEGSSLLLNPGEVMGKEGSATFYVFDTLSRELERIQI